MKNVDAKFLEAVARLKAGIPVAFPTETVYGLGAPVFQEEAVKKIFSLKKRPSDNPLIAHVSSIEEVAKLAVDLPDRFFLLAEKFWPGPLTFILKRSLSVPSIVSAGHDTIAIRMPSHPLALQLIEAVGEPLVAPSANLSGRPSPTRALDVQEDFKELLVLDGGECSIGIESTVIHLVGPIPTILRPGAITRGELESVLKEKVAFTGSKDPAVSPGMKHRHYAPKAKLRLTFQESEAPYLLSSERHPSAVHFNRKNFYSQLREADRLGIEEITIYCGPSIADDEGLMNRIYRAANHF